MNKTIKWLTTLFVALLLVVAGGCDKSNPPVEPKGNECKERSPLDKVSEIRDAAFPLIGENPEPFEGPWRFLRNEGWENVLTDQQACDILQAIKEGKIVPTATQGYSGPTKSGTFKIVKVNNSLYIEVYLNNKLLYKWTKKDV